MNYVFFNPDEMRAESLGVYGHPVCQTPNLDRLAGEGVCFDQCHIQHPVCSPSRCSVMTGWYPHTAGHRTLWHLLRPHEPSLFRYLKEAGYEVLWLGKNDLYARDCFATCVDRYDWPITGKPNVGPQPIFDQDEPGYYSFLASPWQGGPEDHHDVQKVRAACDFLRGRQDGDAPFMLYLPLSCPHPTYAAPQPYHDMYDPDSLPPLRPVVSEGKPDFHNLIRQYRALDRTPEEVVRKLQAVYLGMCSFTDWMLGEVLDCLDETGLAGDTTVVFFSDHGDWAGDYGLVEKWPSALDDTETRVPLLIRAPGNAAGHRVAEPVELFDIMPTTLGLAGLETTHTHFARDLADQLGGAPGDPDRAVYAEGGYDPHEPHCFEGYGVGDDVRLDPAGIYYPKALQQQEVPASVCRTTMLRTMTHKLIHRGLDGAVSELYDLETDPQELHNLIDDPACADIRRQLEQRMLCWYQRTSDAVPPDRDPRGLPPVA